MLRLGRGKIDTRLRAAKWSAPPQSTRDLATLSMVPLGEGSLPTRRRATREA
jgi:hypothetical protein